MIPTHATVAVRQQKCRVPWGQWTEEVSTSRIVVPVQASPKASELCKKQSDGTGTNPFYTTDCNISPSNAMFKPVTYSHFLSCFQLGHVSWNEPLPLQVAFGHGVLHSNRNLNRNSILWYECPIPRLISLLFQNILVAFSSTLVFLLPTDFKIY